MATASARLLERLRACALALPRANERASHGMPTFWIDDKKTFAVFADDHHKIGFTALWFATLPGAQEALTRSDPERFFLPTYVAHRGWAGLRLEGRTDWKLVAALLVDAHAAVASTLPKRRSSPA